MTFAFAFLAVLMVASAGVAMLLRNLIHSALLLIFSWAGIAAFYLWAGAEFVAFAQALVYLGAVSMVVLFAVLLTRQNNLVAPFSAGGAIRASWALFAAAGLSLRPDARTGLRVQADPLGQPEHMPTPTLSPTPSEDPS